MPLFFGSLRGPCGLWTASEIKTDLRFQFSGPKYLHDHVHIACKELLLASEAPTASEQYQSDMADPGNDRWRESPGAAGMRPKMGHRWRPDGSKSAAAKKEAKRRADTRLARLEADPEAGRPISRRQLL